MPIPSCSSTGLAPGVNPPPQRMAPARTTGSDKNSASNSKRRSPRICRTCKWKTLATLCPHQVFEHGFQVVVLRNQFVHVNAHLDDQRGQPGIERERIGRENREYALVAIELDAADGQIAQQ